MKGNLSVLRNSKPHLPGKVQLRRSVQITGFDAIAASVSDAARIPLDLRQSEMATVEKDLLAVRPWFIRAHLDIFPH